MHGNVDYTQPNRSTPKTKQNILLQTVCMQKLQEIHFQNYKFFIAKNGRRTFMKIKSFEIFSDS